MSVSLILNKYIMLLPDSTYLFTLAARNRVLNLSMALGFWKSIVPNEVGPVMNQMSVGKFSKKQSAEQWHPSRGHDNSLQSQICTLNSLESYTVADGSQFGTPTSPRFPKQQLLLLSFPIRVAMDILLIYSGWQTPWKGKGNSKSLTQTRTYAQSSHELIYYPVAALPSVFKGQMSQRGPFSLERQHRTHTPLTAVFEQALQLYVTQHIHLTR